MQKNEERIGTVIAVGSNGEGIIKDDGVIVFVPFCFLEEKIKYKVLKVTSSCAYGKVLEIIIPSKERIEPKCLVYGKCGGCHLQHINYEAGLRVKENIVKTCFSKIANLDLEVSPCVKSDFVYNYRNKLQMPVQETENGTVMGFYATNSHRVVPVKDCPINPKWNSSLINAFLEYFSTYGVKGYNEKDGSGDVREVTAKEINGKIIIAVVSPKKTLKAVKELIEILKENLKTEFSLFYNFNPKNTNVIYGDDFKLLYGESTFDSEMLGIKYKTGVRSFMQVNTSVCEKLYSFVAQNVCDNERGVVIDAYSGAGLMTAILAKRSKKAIGVEIIKEAVEIADNLAKENNLLGKMINYNAKCEDVIPKIVKEETKDNKEISVVLDPPRKGVDVKVINAIKESNVNKIVYVSCMPSTLARDVGLITGSLVCKDGQIVKPKEINVQYKVKTVTPFDMFPNTKHVETVVCLERV